MKRNIGIILCSMMLGFGVTGCLVIPRAFKPEQAVEAEKLYSDGKASETEEIREVAWWSTMYEMPNPEHLPVQVRFQWLKGLE